MTEPATEYLASFGRGGEFGRFRAADPLALRRGQRVVVRSPRGVESAEVLRPASPRHAAFLPDATVGQLLRPLTPDDEADETRLAARAHELYERGRRLADELGLALELLDVELLLDGEHAVLHLLRGDDADVRPFVSTLSREFAVHVSLVDLTRPADEAHGCGRPDCGQKEGGGCTSCGSGGGCGTCGAGGPKDVALYFAQLREQMERRRTALL